MKILSESIAKNTVFIDTGAFYARYVKVDRFHEEATKLWQKVREKHYPIATTSYVLVELLNFLIRKVGLIAALKIAADIYHSVIIKIIPVSVEIEEEALNWLKRFSDQSFSMTDATSFAVMKKYKIQQAFTFDHDFSVAGFSILNFDL